MQDPLYRNDVDAPLDGLSARADDQLLPGGWRPADFVSTMTRGSRGPEV